MDHIKYVSVVLCLCIVIISGCRSSEDSERKPINVEVQQVLSASEKQDLAYSGTIEESETIPLTFSSPGTVARVYVSEGDFVKKGQLLAEIDNTTYRNTYQMTHAAEQQAEDAYNRLTPMHKNGNLSEVKYVEVETALQQARAAAAIAKKNLDDCKLYAAADGYVGKRSVDPGMTAMPNLSSITIVKIAKVYARVSVAEGEIALMKKGAKATIHIGALGDREYIGTVEEIGVVADPIVHSYKIKIAIPNNDRTIKPGMVCNAVLQCASQTRGVVVPNGAVMVDETGKNFVYVADVNQKKAIRVYITAGKLLNTGVEVTGGVNAGMYVVTAGQHKLVDQSAINIVSR